MKLFLNKRRDVIYDSILMIINQYIKIIKYISIIKKIDVAELTKIFFEKIILCFDMSDEIMNDVIIDSLQNYIIFAITCFER